MNNYRLVPVAYAVFADNGNIRIWCADPPQVETLRQKYGEALQPLYTAPQPAEPKAKTPKESWWAGYRAGKGLPANTPIQDAIDAPHVMNVLVEALRSILGWRELRSGNDFPVERIEEIARAALAAHRRQGGDV